MSQTKILNSSESSVKPRALKAGRFWGRLLVLFVLTCVLLIGVAWAFGALWFDFPVAVLRQPLAAVIGLSAIAALVFVRPHWRGQLGVAGAIVLVAAWELAIQPSNTRDWQLLVNGTIAERAYELRAIDTSLPFAELTRLSHINDLARAADRDPAFSHRIREGLPGIREVRITPSLFGRWLARR
jgi:hypothetical protein